MTPGDHTTPLQVEWLPAGWMLITWHGRDREERPATREQAHTFSFDHGLRVCHIGQGGTVCHRPLADTH